MKNIVLGSAALLALAHTMACYSPELDDCAVACSSASDCGPGQACRSDGWCAGPEHAEGCGPAKPPGPGMPPGPGEDDQDEDSLRVVIEGQGQVEIESMSAALKETCSASSPAGATCSYPIAAGKWAALRQKEQGGWKFERWDWPGCGVGKPKSCLVLSGQGETTVVVRFSQP